MVRRDTDFSRLQHTIFNRPVFWSAACQGCVRCHLSRNLILCNMSTALDVKNYEENEQARGDKRRHSWFQGNSRESTESCRGLHWWPKCLDGSTDRLRERSDVPHRSLGIGFLQKWGMKSCRQSLPRFFPFGLTNERCQSRCLGPINFQERKQRRFKRKIQPCVYESQGPIWQSSLQYIGTEEQIPVWRHPYGFIMGFRPSSHLRTVYFTKPPAGGTGCQILMSHPVFHVNNMQTELIIPQTEQLDFQFRIFAVDLLIR